MENFYPSAEGEKLNFKGTLKVLFRGDLKTVGSALKLVFSMPFCTKTLHFAREDSEWLSGHPSSAVFRRSTLLTSRGCFLQICSSCCFSGENSSGGVDHEISSSRCQHHFRLCWKQKSKCEQRGAHGQSIAMSTHKLLEEVICTPHVNVAFFLSLTGFVFTKSHV